MKVKLPVFNLLSYPSPLTTKLTFPLPAYTWYIPFKLRQLDRKGQRKCCEAGEFNERCFVKRASGFRSGLIVFTLLQHSRRLSSEDSIH
jgi:hypothetical protein